jgi:lambda family phage portal protein
MAKAPAFDRFLLNVAPGWALSRSRSRAMAQAFARHYDAASSGRRTSNWPQSGADANQANAPALSKLRAVARDLRRNNPWARRGLQVIPNNTVGWGIVAKPDGDAPGFLDAWNRWADTTACDAEGRLTFYGMQRQIMEAVAGDGEILIRRRWRRPEDGFDLPFQLQVLEADYLDTTRDNETGLAGGPIIQGVEYDKIGRRAAYWLYEAHPGSRFAAPKSYRYAASEVAHVFRADRPGQVRGVSWLAPVIVRLREFDEYEDATIMRHKIAALFAAFVTDPQGDPALSATGEVTTGTNGEPVETLEPGMIKYLAPGQTVEFGQPPVAQDGGFSERALRSIASGLGVTYEDLTGDYSRVNYSSGRLGWLAHWANVEDWRWNMLVPQFCDRVWGWAIEAAVVAGLMSSGDALPATWTPPARPMIDPDKEGLAAMRRIRSGIATLPEVIREQGKDPDAHLAEIAAANKKLDALGIVLDSDPRNVTQAGQLQAAPTDNAPPVSEPAASDAEEDKPPA